MAIIKQMKCCNTKYKISIYNYYSSTSQIQGAFSRSIQVQVFKDTSILYTKFKYKFTQLTIPGNANKLIVFKILGFIPFNLNNNHCREVVFIKRTLNCKNRKSTVHTRCISVI